MLKDRYENPISTSSTTARDHYVDGLDRLLSGSAGVGETFNAAIEADPQFALAYCGLARIQQVIGDQSAARASTARAQELADGITEREATHIKAMVLLTNGKAGEAYQLIRKHLTKHPRDALLAQTCTSVFGLIGFSGRPGREAELLAYTESLRPHYGDDWWFLCQHAFSLCETGQLDRADKMIDQSLAICPRSAHSAHIRAHVYYEGGEIASGAKFLDEWIPGYDKAAYLNCHLSWHIALWALEQGQTEKLWETVDNSVMPGGTWGPPLNVLTDAAAILYRAELAGETVPDNYWQSLSDYSAQFFPKPGLAFADVHAALCHAMAGQTDALQTIISGATGPAGDVVKSLAAGFGAIADQNWEQASHHLIAGMSDHARIGGSRAQRDLLEYALTNVLLKQGKTSEAQRLLLLRRPVQAAAYPVAGLA